MSCSWLALLHQYITGMETSLPCNTDTLEGLMTVLKLSTVVSELAVVTMRGTTVASETITTITGITGITGINILLTGYCYFCKCFYLK